MYVESELLFKMVPCEYCILVIFSNYFTVKRGNLAYFSSFLSLLKSNLKKSLIGSTQLGPFWIAIMNLYIKSFQKIYIFWECLIFCLNQILAGCDFIEDQIYNGQKIREIKYLFISRVFSPLDFFKFSITYYCCTFSLTKYS